VPFVPTFFITRAREADHSFAVASQRNHYGRKTMKLLAVSVENRNGSNMAAAL
jgi:hypothetical protein